MSEREVDLAIIGAGPGGYVSALRAAHHGLRVTLVEEKHLGGVCLHTGCIPTKSLIASVGVLRQARGAGLPGLNLAPAAADLAAINARGQRIVQQLAGGVKHLLEKNQVQVVRGRATLRSAKLIDVCDAAGQVMASIANPRAILLATGSRPADLPVAPRDGTHILNSSDVLTLNQAPPALLILGGGYIGCEFASVFAGLGSRVAIIEALDRLLPGMDRELGQALERSFKKAGIQVFTSATVKRAEVIARGASDASPASAADPRLSAEEWPGAVTVTLADGRTLRGDQLLVSVGRVPNVEGLGLEHVGVKRQGRFIAVNDFMETSVPGIYAIGDVVGQMALAHVATAQGRVVVENLLAAREGRPRQRMSYQAVPGVVFTHPEIAAVGLTEEQAAQRGLTVRVGRFPFAALGRAWVSGETEGFVKLLADATTGRLLGAHIFGAHASELIGQLTLAIHLRATARQLVETIFAHPTFNEAVLEAAEALFGQATHVFSRR